MPIYLTAHFLDIGSCSRQPAVTIRMTTGHLSRGSSGRGTPMGTGSRLCPQAMNTHGDWLWEQRKMVSAEEALARTKATEDK